MLHRVLPHVPMAVLTERPRAKMVVGGGGIARPGRRIDHAQGNCLDTVLRKQALGRVEQRLLGGTAGPPDG